MLNNETPIPIVVVARNLTTPVSINNIGSNEANVGGIAYSRKGIITILRYSLTLKSIIVFSINIADIWEIATKNSIDSNANSGHAPIFRPKYAEGIQRRDMKLVIS